jgi:hypothetical protein
MRNLIHPKFVLLALTISAFLLGISFGRPVESAKRYQYHVIAVTGATQLRTQDDSEQGRMKTIENIVNEQVAQGWEFYQADGYVLYFRR